MKEKDLRRAIITACRELERAGINQGTSGNISCRIGDHLLITPSAVPYAVMKPEMVARMPIAGEYGAWSGPVKPSSEWRMHLDILRARPEVGAVVHTHALYATTVSTLREPLPAVHYMIAAFGGPTIRCTDYAPFGSKELSDLAVEGLKERHGVLLGTHGMIVTGADLGEAMWRAIELETLAKIYVLGSGIGQPAILPDDEIERIVDRFKTYGYKPPSPPKATRRDAGKTGSKPLLKPARKALAGKGTKAEKKTRPAARRRG